MRTEQRATDTESFTDQLVAHRAMIFRYLITLVASRTDAEELYQKTCLTMWQKWSTGTMPEYFGAWARAIALNHARNFIRSRKHAPGLMTEGLLEAIAARREELDDHLQRRVEALRHCREKLPAEHRRVLSAYYGSGDSVELVAHRLKRPKAGLYKLLQRIRKRLLDCISRREDQEEN